MRGILLKAKSWEEMLRTELKVSRARTVHMHRRRRKTARSGQLKREKEAIVRPGQQVRAEGQGWCFGCGWEQYNGGGSAGVVDFLFVKDSKTMVVIPCTERRWSDGWQGLGKRSNFRNRKERKRELRREGGCQYLYRSKFMVGKLKQHH